MPTTQANRPFAVATHLGEDATPLISFSYTEEAGRPFTLLVTAELRKSAKASDFIGKPMLLRIAKGPGKTRWIHSFIARAEIMPDSGVEATVRLTGRPAIWMLSHSSDCRVFENKPTIDIVCAVFAEAKIAGMLQMKAKPVLRPSMTIQYRETDLNFVSRLLEASGIWYTTEHTKSGHTVVCCDDSTTRPAIGPGRLPYAWSGDGASIESFAPAASAAAGAFDYLAYDYKEAFQIAGVSENNSAPHALGQGLFDYPQEVHTRDLAKTLAKIRAEELACGSEEYIGRTDSPEMEVGSTFTLFAPSGGLPSNLPGAYFITAVSISGSIGAYRSGDGDDGDTFSCTFRCINKTVKFRPARITPKPIIAGYQTAFVDGGSDNASPCDKFGRVPVRFIWQRGGSPSAPIRVAQAMAGNAWGGQFLPRGNQEVVVTFLDGDPDKPLIIGAVYNGKAEFPYPPDKNPTITTIKTHAGSSFNELCMEDKSGSEMITLHAAKGLDTIVKETARTEITKDYSLAVKGKTMQAFTGDVSAKIDGNENVKVGQDASLDVGMNSHVKVGMNHGVQAGMNVYLKGGVNTVIEAGVGLTLKVGGNYITINPAGIQMQGTMVMINSGGAALAGSAPSPKSPEAPESPVVPGSPKTTAKPPPPPAKPSRKALVTPMAISLAEASDNGSAFI